MWAPVAGRSITIRKSSLRQFPRSVIAPAIMRSGDVQPSSPPLPWAWIASYALDEAKRAAFKLWWQLCALHKAFPSAICPWCDSKPSLTAQHLQTGCDVFAVRCWTNGIQPEQAFLYPIDAQWSKAVLSTIGDLMKAQKQAGKLKPQPSPLLLGSQAARNV